MDREAEELQLALCLWPTVKYGALGIMLLGIRRRFLGDLHLALTFIYISICVLSSPGGEGGSASGHWGHSYPILCTRLIAYR